MEAVVLGALKWEPQIKGALYVIIAVVVLPGSGFLLLSTNMGARVGALLALAGLFGWMATLGAVWWVYGTGPKGTEPTWKSVTTVQGDLASSGSKVLAKYPHGWKKLAIDNAQVGDATAVAESSIVGPKARFKKSSDFVIVGAAEKGGDAYGPLHLLNTRPFNVFHTAHYLFIQVQEVLPAVTVAGQPPPKPAPNPAAEPVTVVTVRDLGSVRFKPAVFCLACATLFGVVVYFLHSRDREAMAAVG